MIINTNTWNKVRYTVYQPFYDIIAAYFRPLRKQSIEELHLKTGEKVLIIGAGTGLDLEFLSKDIEIHAIDITPSMINRLKNRANKLELDVKAQVMDGGNLDFESESFDAVILHLIIAVIPDPVSCLNETTRVLKAGGRFTIMDKFVKSGQKPGILRKLINPVAILIATNLNRDIDHLISQTNLKKTSDRSLRSIFRLIKGNKPI